MRWSGDELIPLGPRDPLQRFSAAFAAITNASGVIINGTAHCIGEGTGYMQVCSLERTSLSFLCTLTVAGIYDGKLNGRWWRPSRTSFSFSSIALLSHRWNRAAARAPSPHLLAPVKTHISR